MRIFYHIIAALLLCECALAQNYWSPDSTAYRYLSRGTNVEQWVASTNTHVEVDTTSFRTAGGSIKWTVPANTRGAALELRLLDLDLRGFVLYTTCKRNNYASPINASLIVAPGKGFRLHEPVYVHHSGKHLPADFWQQRGRTTSLTPYGGATLEDLAHVRSVQFRAYKVEAEQILWIDEVKYIKPRGPVGVIHFNHYRNTADSLLTPWLLARGYRANADFTYEYAEKELRENRNNAGILTRYIGLDRIAELVQQYGWSTTDHGVFYKFLTKLPPEARQELYALAPFQQAGFEVQWCFSIPSDEITPELYVELLGLQRFAAIRRQGDKRPNELPIDEPQQLRFFRPTSASAGPNVSGTPRTLAEMKAEVLEAFNMKGLLIFDFGAIVTSPSEAYTGSEVTVLEEAQGLIEYADSLGYSFLTFKDLFAPDPNYQSGLSINHDYSTIPHNFWQVLQGSEYTFEVLRNDLVAAADSLWIESVGPAQHGEVRLDLDRRRVHYAPRVDFDGSERFYYVATNGALRDTAWVFVNATGSSTGPLPEGYALYQNFPNPFYDATIFAYELAAPAFVELLLYNVRGQVVATVVREQQPAGNFLTKLIGEELSAGVYFYQLKLNGRVVARKKTLRLKSAITEE
jgi:hypothetical protein